MATRPEKGRGPFYTRDSDGKHEMSLPEYVLWAQRKAKEIGAQFDGKPETIERMAKQRIFQEGDLFLDYGVSGNQMSRPALDALFEEVENDPTISHVFIPRRDRFARPDDPMDAVILEKKLRCLGVTLVFMDRVLKPLKRGSRQDIAELISAVVDYEKSGKDRRELGEKMIHAQLRLAKLGFSIGGRPPYGFHRWLAKDDGTTVRQLTDGERVRMSGHHVVWLPGAENEIQVIRRIIDMLEQMPASRVAAILTKEGVPTPNAGRTRTDRRVKHIVGGVWSQSVVIGVARNPLLSAMASYGRRCMGDQVRFTPTGPRELEDADRRSDGKPKVIRNNADAVITQPVAVPFEPIVEPTRQARLIAVLDQRAGRQRGKPRSIDPNNNPLGSRVFDMTCNWPMYRTPYNGSFRHVCGLYQQSHGQRCEHNHVPGPDAVSFVLSYIRQTILVNGLEEKMERRLREIAQEERTPTTSTHDRERLPRELRDVQTKIAKVTENLALAESVDHHKRISAYLDGLIAQETMLNSKIRENGAALDCETDVEADIAAAMDDFKRASQLAAGAENFADFGDLFRRVNARLFLRFQKMRVKQRELNRLASGIVTIGDEPLPISIYDGKTGRGEVKGPAVSLTTGPCSQEAPPRSAVTPEGRDGSLGNVSRGDRI